MNREFKAKLVEGPVGRHLTKMSVPMTWGLFAVIAFNLVDTFFVAQLGSKQLAAISFTFPVVMVFSSLALGLGVGSSAVISRAIGKGDVGMVKQLTTNSLALALLVVFVLIVIGYFTIDPLFIALGAKEDTLGFIRDYMKIWYLGAIFVVVPMVGNSALRASGDALFPSLIMTVSGLLNAILDPILIFGLLGCPRLELEGAAIATVIARATTLVASVAVLHFRERMLIVPKLGTMWASWKKILHVGLPAAATNAINPICTGVITAVVATFGAEAVAGFGVATRVEAFALIVMMAVSASLSAFVGQNYGAKKFDRLRTALKLTYRFSIGYGLFIATILAIFAEPLVRLFSDDPTVIRVASLYLWIVPATFTLQGLGFLTTSTFNALGKPLVSTSITLSRMLVLYIPLAWVLSKFFEINGVFSAAAVANIVTGLVAYFWGRKILSRIEKS